MLRKGLVVLAISLLFGALSSAGIASAEPDGDRASSKAERGPTAQFEGRFTNYRHPYMEGAGIHTCRSSTCSHLAIIPGDRPVTDFCHATGQYLVRTSNWDLVYYNGVAGWTNTWWLNSAAQSLQCASTGSHYMRTTGYLEGAGIHTCRHGDCQVLGFIPVGASVVSFCTQPGQALAHGKTGWDLVYYNGVAGWTHKWWLTNESQSTSCEPSY